MPQTMEDRAFWLRLAMGQQLDDGSAMVRRDRPFPVVTTSFPMDPLDCPDAHGEYNGLKVLHLQDVTEEMWEIVWATDSRLEPGMYVYEPDFWALVDDVENPAKVEVALGDVRGHFANLAHDNWKV